MRRKIFRAIWKAKSLSKTCFLGKFRTHFLRSIFKKSGVFTFPFISFDCWCVVRFRFFYGRNDMIQGHLLDTSNMVIGCVENFLERSEKQNHLQKRVFWRSFEPIFWDRFFKKSGDFAFQIALKNFLRIQWPCSRYPEGAPRSYHYAHKKIGAVRRTNQKIS